MPRIILLFFCWMVRIASGCNLQDTNSIKVTKYPGEYVLLPCSCANLQDEPHHLRWMKNTHQQIYPTKSHLPDRIHMFNQESPGNLSLLISDLTKEDEGNYRCEGWTSSYRDITLTVKECSLMEKNTRFEIVKSSGESVLLPCSCSPLHVKPESVNWDVFRWRGFREINLLIKASVLPSKAPPKTHTPVTKEKDSSRNGGTKTPLYIFILVAVLLLLLLLGVVIFLYMRHKGQKGEMTKSGQIQEDEQKDDTRVYCTVQETRDDMFTRVENQDEVTYSTVIHSNKHRAAQVEMDTDDSTEYARIKRT
ncbi:hypothetical protein AALO_G00134620 [Alosa alosa]|uniref:Ig-like domain-containing protein n=1 Tax=Alosa alosa TaxID=278164 RepID=A0AAV6GH57_9TELE|nr:hypothetical protein AALO_G00134620 [Alosa alosa]